MSFVTVAAIVGGGALAGSLGSALIGSNAANSAAQQAASGNQNALLGIQGGEQAGAAALSPYYTGGLQNYDFLNYLLTGNANPQNAQALTPDQQAREGLLQSLINWDAAPPGAQGELATLQQQGQAAQAAQGAQAAATGSGLPANYLTNIPAFNYDPTKDTNLIGAGNLASQQIAAQQAAGGGFGSGNMASSIAEELAGTLEPQYYQMAANTYNVNQIQPRTMLYNMLTGSTGGAGQSAAGSLANVYTGQATNAAPYSAGIGNALASGTMGSANAYTNALTGTSNNAMGAGNLYVNYLNSQNTANALSGLNNTGINSAYNSSLNNIDWSLNSGESAAWGY
jgi:hypothetical protein